MVNGRLWQILDLVVVVLLTVLAIILVRRATVVATVGGSTVTGRCQGAQMRGTGMLHLGGLNGHAIVDDRDVDGTLMRIAGGVALGVTIVAGIPATVIATIVPGAVRAAGRGGLGESGKVGGLGVLHFGCIDGHSVVDHRHMVATVGNGSDGMTGTSGSVGSEVGGLGVLNLGSLDGSTMGVSHLTQSLGMGSIVFSLSGLHVGCIDWHATMGEGHVSRSSTIGPATAIDRTLVQMMASIVRGSGMSSSMGSLGVLNFRCVNGDAAMGQHRDVDAMRMLSVWHVSGMGSGIDGSYMGHSWRLRQIGANSIEAMMWIRSVRYRLQMAMSIDIGIGAARGAVMSASLVLL